MRYCFAHQEQLFDESRPAMTNAQAEHRNNAGHHYAQALHTALDGVYEAAHQAALDALRVEAEAEDTAREAADLHNTYLNTAREGVLFRAYWLDDDLLSGMFAAMTHRELHDEYGLQEIIVATGDYTDMFDLRHP